MATQKDIVSWKQSELELRKLAHEQPGGFSATVKRALAQYFDTQSFKELIAESVAEGIRNAGVQVGARPVEPQPPAVNRNLTKSLFAGRQ